jgi:stage II sporulation protein D
MSVKRKLILIGICVIIVIAVFAVNVIRGVNEEKELQDMTVQEKVITRAEAYRLLSYLEYDRGERESLERGITYSGNAEAGWYDPYVNAVWKMGLIESSITVAPTEALSYGTCKEYIDKLITKKPELQRVYDGLSFDFGKADAKMDAEDFIELYKALIALLPQEEQKITEETLFVLGTEADEQGTDRLVTDTGKFYYEHSMDSVASYMDKGIKAFVCKQEIILLDEVTTEPIVLQNIWLKSGEGTRLNAFINGIDKEFETKYDLSQKVENTVCDITVEDQKVVKILRKPDAIRGKVLRTGQDYIEIEGYGKIPLEKNYKIYKLYGKLSVEPTNSILVGYDNTEFVVSLGKISAALIRESIKAENIRVLISTSGYKSYYHDKLELSATSDFILSYKDTEKEYKKGEAVTLEPGNALLSQGRIKVSTKDEDGRIQLRSVERSDGIPSYRGSIEIAEGERGLLVVNELPLEEYLYAVIPSEMPTYYGLEALKVQAVCARSYAYKHLLANSLSQYGAHVDDSVAFQVYNNISENEDSILAVKDTYGKVIEYQNEVITAYYFSTSCGHTADAGSVWANGQNYPYLQGKLLYTKNEKEGTEDDAAESGATDTVSYLEQQYSDLSTEENFKSFMEAKDVSTYDSGFNWYRWKVTMKVNDIKKVINQNLATRYQANPELILTKTGQNEKKEDVYESIPVDNIGNIVDVSVAKRETSGIISELILVGSDKTVKVKTEYNIRALLAPVYDTVIRQDDSEVNGLSLLPSAFFLINKKEKEGKLNAITLVGGGYGHGVGMSQNGVKALADAGSDYERILKYFYTGTSLAVIYE